MLIVDTRNIFGKSYALLSEDPEWYWYRKMKDGFVVETGEEIDCNDCHYQGNPSGNNPCVVCLLHTSFVFYINKEEM